MKLLETLSKIAPVTLRHLADGRYSASLEGVEISVRNRMLTCACGEGATVEDALRNLLREILGKILIQYATSPERRREFMLIAVENSALVPK